MSFLLPTPHPYHLSTTTTTTVRSLPPRATTKSDVALLWFKHDLRLDDHPALVSSAQHYQSVLPLYIFDHRIISRFSDETLEIALSALKDLKCLLEDQGSNLMIRFGTAEDVILEIVNQLGLNQQIEGIIHVFAEEEVEYKLRRVIHSVDKCLSDLSQLKGRTKLVHWRTPFYDIQDLEKLPAFYSDMKRLNLSQASPLASPVLPRLDIDLDWGGVPTFDEVKAYCMSVTQLNLEDWSSLKQASAKSVLSKRKSRIGEGPRKSNPNEGSNISIARRGKLEDSGFISREGTMVGGGTSTVLNALAAYLRYLEGTSRYDWQEVHEKLRNAESRSGASFGALFRSALSLGIISRRRVFYESIKYERERNGGFLSPFGYSAQTVAAAADTVASMEWYWLMALKSQSDKLRRYPIHIWKWNDYLIQYTVVGEGPAVLLVHGFGAFLEHYRDNLAPLAGAGNRVWALTLLGFGKSEKPNVVYTELMWAELLRDFIVDVVGEPAHLVGNSIGGYFVSIVAGLWPSLAKSIMLINTAGSVITGNPSLLLKEEREASRAAWLGSRGLLFYLKLRVGNIVKNCYPTKKERVDEWLINEMLRAADDPGVIVVLESLFSFNLSIPLNYLFESFGGKVLIIQGMKDPLSNSKSKLSAFREHCKGVEIRELDAGHCPQDEQPEEVNALICEWIVNLEKKRASEIVNCLH